MKGMVGWVTKILRSFGIRSWIMFAKRAGANENESGITTLRLRSGYSLPVHRCLFKVYLLYLLYVKLYILPIYSRGNIYGPFAYPRFRSS